MTYDISYNGHLCKHYLHYRPHTEQMVKWLEEEMGDDEEDISSRIDGCEEIEVVLMPPEDGMESDHDDEHAKFMDLGRDILAQPGEIRDVSKKTGSSIIGT